MNSGIQWYIWKFPAHNKKGDLQYVGISLPFSVKEDPQKQVCGLLPWCAASCPSRLCMRANLLSETAMQTEALFQETESGRHRSHNIVNEQWKITQQTFNALYTNINETTDHYD